jgi:pilus assembly protein CpaD
MGVARSRILVGTHPAADGDRRVEVGFVSYVAHTQPCGDWSQNAADSDSNLPLPNFGCSVQHNIAAMVANPRDLDESRRLDESPDAARRVVVMGHYEKGEVTQADKHTKDKASEQSSGGSDVGN